MIHVSTKTIDSKFLPGVRFVIKRMTKRRTDALDELQSAFKDKLRPLYEEFTPLNDARHEAVEAASALAKPERQKLITAGATEVEAAKRVPMGAIGFPDDKLKRWAELWGEISKIDQNEMAPVAARFCLVRIEELDITYPDVNGTDQTSHATLDLILEHGPDELYQEILLAIKRECGLLPEEAEDLNSPSTSAAPVDGKPESAEGAGTLETTIPLAA